MALSAAGCEASCANEVIGKGVPKQMGPTKRAGPTLTLPRSGCLACNKPMPRPVSPLAGNTTDWRAGCGRSARPVRREGGSKPIDAPYPYPSFEADSKIIEAAGTSPATTPAEDPVLILD